MLFNTTFLLKNPSRFVIDKLSTHILWQPEHRDICILQLTARKRDVRSHRVERVYD